MTRAAFAERLNVSVLWFSRGENGEDLTLTTLEKLAKALEISGAQLLEAPKDEPREVKRGRPRKPSTATKSRRTSG